LNPEPCQHHADPSADAMRDQLVARLLDERTPDGLWEGRLASSALSTAVAAFALHRLDPVAHRPAVDRALRWLVTHANADGGWGDTPRSRSNASTTLLCRAALSAAQASDHAAIAARDAADAWIARAAGSTHPDAIAALVLTCYGNDRTFSIPILVMVALAGLLGPDEEAWRRLPRLPFELAALPSSWYRFVGLPVVSYALPALIAMGLLQHRRHRSRAPGLGALRDAATPLVLVKLTRLQPASGGFLEAAPLTGFVALSLAAAGESNHPVVLKAREFLLGTVRPDGSWPIDTNLKTWVTTLAVQALAGDDGLSAEHRAALASVRNWLLRTQHRVRHPYTGAAPGGWAWTDLSGGVPDADDTAGALLALRALDPTTREARRAAESGLRWLLALQNRDGGLPTFCRGWGRLPFDRSCPDLTAHAIAAMQAWHADVSPMLRRRLTRAMKRAVGYLARAQRADGNWAPLWFGNEWVEGGENRTYGTAKAMLGLARLRGGPLDAHVAPMLSAGAHWLEQNVNDDGGWGGGPGAPSTVEETALAVQALAVATEAPSTLIAGGLDWIARHPPVDGDAEAAPIGLYFASLWYWERLYPLIYATGAFRLSDYHVDNRSAFAIIASSSGGTHVNQTDINTRSP
jgi:squalene-hopene/tetraprenyl-beta-curcumene cyclase